MGVAGWFSVDIENGTDSGRTWMTGNAMDGVGGMGTALIQGVVVFLSLFSFFPSCLSFSLFLTP